MKTQKLVWLFYLVPYSLILVIVFDIPTVLSKGLTDIVRTSITFIAIVICYLYSFDKERLLHPKFRVIFFYLALADELIMFVQVFELKFYILLTFTSIIPSLVILWLASRKGYT